MEYQDKEIIQLRNNQKKNRYVDSTTGMYAGNKLLKFHKKKLFEINSIMTPESFQEMDSVLARKKYPTDDRPQVILAEESGEINFTFSQFAQDMEPGMTDGTLEEFKLMLRTTQPANQFMNSGHIENKDCCWMEFKSFTLDGVLYNMLSLTGFKENLIMGMFNCPYAESIIWKPIMLELLNTLCEEEEVQ